MIPRLRRLLHKAIGDQFTCVFVDNGLLRLHEGDQVMAMFASNMGGMLSVDAEDLFLSKPAVNDPSRKIIGNTFIDVFDAKRPTPDVNWLAQGTIYPDVTNLRRPKSKPRHQSHHGVGGLPEP